VANLTHPAYFESDFHPQENKNKFNINVMAKGKSTPRKATKKKATKKAGRKTAKKPAKKAAPPKKAVKKAKKTAKKTVSKKKAAKKAGSKAPRVLLSANEQSSIRFDVKFSGGGGQIFLKGQNVDEGPDSDTNFSADQDPGRQRVFVAGTAPAGTGGKIQVQVSEGGTVLSPFSANSFTGNEFQSVILYTVS
jgi:hypothetical protein